MRPAALSRLSRRRAQAPSRAGHPQKTEGKDHAPMLTPHLLTGVRQVAYADDRRGQAQVNRGQRAQNLGPALRFPRPVPDRLLVTQFAQGFFVLAPVGNHDDF